MAEITEAGTPGLVAQAPTDGLRISQDFPPPPEPPKVDPAPVTPPALLEEVREIDLGDGSGKQRFIGKGATREAALEDVANQLQKSQEHATRKIRELSQTKPRITPDKEPLIKPHTLSEAEILALKEGFSADPVSSFNKLFQAQTGLTVDDFRQNQLAIAEANAERAFIAKHKDDFLPCPENATKINKFLAEQELPKTTKNLEYAFYELGESLQKKTVEPAAVLPPPPVPRAEAPKVSEIPPPPVSIPANFGQRVDMQTTDGVSAADYAQIATLPPEQMKARIEQLFRSGRR